MADKRTFTIEIDGVQKAYADVHKLWDVLQKLKDVNVRVAAETGKAGKAYADSAKKVKEKTAAVSNEEKAEKALQKTLEQRKELDTQLAREQLNANLALKERAEQLQRSIELENAAGGSLNEMRLKLESLQGEYRALSEEQRNSEQVGGALLSQIQELNSSYQQLEGTLQSTTSTLESAGGSLEATLSRLHRQVDATTKGVEGILNLFKAGVGVLALFGGQSEATTKALKKIEEILVIVTALQKANNLLLKEGALLSKSSAVMEGIHAVQIKARAAATALSTKNTIAATVAQRIFNAVAMANPYVLLAMALVSVVGALAAFAIGTDKSTEVQKDHNSVVENSIELKNQHAVTVKKLSEANIEGMEKELNLLKARGASEAQIAKKQKQIYEEKVKQARNNSKIYQKEIQNIRLNARMVNHYEQEIKKMYDGLEKGTHKNNKAFKEKAKTLEGYLKMYQQYLDIGLQAQKEEEDAIHQLDMFNAQTAQKALEAGKKSALAMAEYRVLIAKKGSQEELEAQIKAARQRLRNDLSNAELTGGERIKRVEETEQQIEKLKEDYRKNELKRAIEILDAQLILAEKGSTDEFNLRAARLERQRELELEQKNLSVAERKLIEDKYQLYLDELGKEYEYNRTEIAINTEIATLNARLAVVRAGSQEELEIRIKLAEKTAQLAEENIHKSISDEQLKAAKILEINEKLQRDIRKLSSDSEISQVEKSVKEETLMLQKQLEEKKISRLDYDEQMLKLTVDSLEKEIEIRKKYGQDTTDLEIKLSETRIEQAQFVKNKVGEHFKQLHEKLQKYVDGIMTGVTAIFDATNSLLQSQLDEAREKYDAVSDKYDELVAKKEASDSRLQELEEEAKTARGGRLLVLRQQIQSEMQANQQLASQEQDLAKQKEKLEKDMAKKEKQQKKAQIINDIVQAISNTSLGATSALKWGFPLGPVYAGIISASGALQVGVMAKQLAKLEDGGLLRGKSHASGGMRIEGTNIEVEGGEYVVNKESTRTNMGLIRYINSQRRELDAADISNFFSKPVQPYEPPFRKLFEEGGQLPAINNTVNIDNDSLIEAIQSIRIEPQVSVNDINSVQRTVVRVNNWSGM